MKINNRDSEILRCPTCFANSFSQNEDHWICENCSSNFPVFNSIPLLFDNVNHYIVQTFLEYHKWILEEESRIQRLSQNEILKKDRVDEITKALIFNYEFIKKLKSKLEEFISPRDILSNGFVNRIQYLDNFDYARRDWCFEEESEKEISIICNSLSKHINSNLRSKTTCLALGAGAARLAVELGEGFNQVFAIDNSFTMGSIFGELLTADFEFYEINLKNNPNSSSVVYKQRASLGNKLPSKKINYLLADSLNAPFNDSSISCVLSIYFTDVVPLNSLLPELKRLLSEDGIFVHFGPLQYHFNDYSQMLAADEIEELFHQEGFEIVHSSFVQTSHYKSKVSMLSKMYENWVFIARLKKEQTNISRISFSSILEVNSTQFMISGELNNGEIQIGKYEIGNEKLKITEIIFEFLQILNGDLTVEQVLTKMGLINDLNTENKNRVLEALRDLAYRNIIKIKKL